MMATRRKPAGGRPGELAALQAALAAEDAASYGYGVVGAHLAGSAFALATSDCVIHERARDALVKLITSLGASPEPAAVAYRLPFRVATARQAAELAATLELSVAAGYLDLVAVDDRALRTLAATRMQDAAVRAARWGGRPAPFPGLAPQR
jgi:hypothetical protein